MEPLLTLGNVRINAFDRITSRARDEWWSTMQYYLEGGYNESDITRVMTASVERQTRELLDQHKEDWQWEKASGGERLWEIAPDARNVDPTDSNAGTKVQE
jgi:acetoin utilization deacetylase AcuC-like enzyme